MKCRLFKKLTALVLTLVMALSVTSVSLAASAAEAQGSSVSGSFKTFGVNKLYTTGFLVAGKAVTTIAGLTDNAAVEKIASIANVYVFGGNNTAAALKEITALCNEILAEVEKIDRNLTNYSAEIVKMLGEQAYKDLYDTLDLSWDEYVLLEGNDYQIYVNEAYEDYMEYMQVVQKYVDARGAGEDVSSADADIEAAKEKLLEDFIKIYGKDETTSITTSEDEELYNMFTTTSVDDVMKEFITGMASSNALYRYANAAAQYAYGAVPFSGDQYDIIINNINNQYMRIVTMEMMYSEFMAMRADYLDSEKCTAAVEKYGSDNEKADVEGTVDSLWEGYTELMNNFNEFNADIADNMNDALDNEFTISATGVGSIKMKLTDYVQNDTDNNNVVSLTNTAFKSSKDDYDDVNHVDDSQGSALAKYVSNAEVTSQNMNFIKVGVPTGNGCKVYYILDPEQFGSGSGVPDSLYFYNMLDKVDVSINYDVHVQSCDFYNYVGGSYNDGSNVFKCITGTGDLQTLFDTTALKYYNSQTSDYLNAYIPQFAEYEKYFPTTSVSAKHTYFLTPETRNEEGVFQTLYPWFTVIDSSQQIPSFSSFETTELDGQDIQEDGDDKNTTYSVALVNSGSEFTSVIDVKTTDSTSDIYIATDSGNVTSTTAKAGDEVSIKFKLGERKVIDNITLTLNDSAGTNERVCLDSDALRTMTIDEDGYYTVPFNATYNGSATLTLNTVDGYTATIDEDLTERLTYTADDGVSKTGISLGSHSTLYAQGEAISVTIDGKVADKVGMLCAKYTDSDGTVCTVNIPLTDTSRGGKEGSFTMPASDVNIYDAVLPTDEDGCYIITCYDDLCKMRDMVNSGQEEYTSATYIVTNDIECTDEWDTPIGTADTPFTGTFDGQGHTISNFKLNTTGSYMGLFGYIKGATVKNFTLDGEININAEGNEIGGVVGCADGGTVSNVYSNVDVTNEQSGETVHHVGGVVGGITQNATTVEKCMFDGTLVINNSTDCIGGVVGYSDTGGTIVNCACRGSISRGDTDEYVGGILGYLNNKSVIVKNCYTSSDFLYNTADYVFCGAIIGWVRDYSKDNVSNNYWLSGRAFGSAGNTPSGATAKTKEQFASGEVCYLLNSGVTNGTQVWYQDIDNDVTPYDDYPLFSGGAVYQKDDGTYTNTVQNPEPDPFDKDDDGCYIIDSYDDLVTLAQYVSTDCDKYGSADYVLTANIFNTDESIIWSNPIGSTDKPFNGTFDGQGYIISGLNVSCGDSGGLFGTIGSSGTVKDLMLVDCDYTEDSGTAGSVAAVNNGTIDHCLSGLNTTSPKVVRVVDGETVTVYLTPYNSEIKANDESGTAGGIVGVNNGTIIGTRNAGEVSGSVCGGIAGENYGSVIGCENSGTIGTSAAQICGGIAGKNFGEVRACYVLTSLTGSSKDNMGAVVGLNESVDGAAPTVTDNIYRTTTSEANSYPCVGSASSVSVDETNTAMLPSQMMVSDSGEDALLPMLNAASQDDGVEWIRNEASNDNYPIIKCDFCKLTTKDAGDGITVTGYMHSALNISYEALSDTSAFASALSDNNITVTAYAPTVTDGSGNSDGIISKLWLQSEATVTVPLTDKDAKLLVMSDDGTVSEQSFEYSDGKATFTATGVQSFAFASKASAGSGTTATGSTGTNGTTAASGSVQTGINLFYTVIPALLALCAFALIAYTRRKEND